MADEKAVQQAWELVKALANKTDAGKVKWTKADTQGCYETRLGKFVMQLFTEQDPDYPKDPDYVLVVLDRTFDRDIEIERISNVSLRSISDQAELGETQPYSVLQATYEAARRQALDIDGALGNLLQELEKA